MLKPRRRHPSQTSVRLSKRLPLKQAASLLIGALCMILGLSSQSAKALEISGNPIGCKAGSARYLFVELQGKVLLDKALLPTMSAQNQERFFRDAIELQTKHLIGYFRTTSEAGLNAAISSYRGTLKVLPAQETTYGAAFKLDHYYPQDRGNSSSPYIQNALKRGSVQASDPALLVPYQQQLLIADCTDGGFQSKAKIELPLDPYLSFWIESKAKRKGRAFAGATLSEMSNCFSSEFVQFGNLDINWFFWSPAMPKQDPSGHTYRCQPDQPMRVYQPGVTALREAAPSPSLDKSFFGNLKTLKSSAFFGIISEDSYFPKLDFAKLKTQIQNAATFCKTSPSVPDCLTAWDQLIVPDPKSDKPGYEPGAFHFLTFLRYLHHVLSVREMKVEASTSIPGEIQVKYEGHFIDSPMPVSGTVYFGRTNLDYGPHASKTYVKLLHSAFKDSNTIFYVGHAGLGHNFSVNEFEKLWREEHLPSIQREQPLWVGIYNCEGFSYFGFDQERLFKKDKLSLLLTESSGTEAGAKFPLSQLAILNQAFLGQTIDVKSAMANYVRSREFATELTLSSKPAKQGAP